MVTQQCGVWCGSCARVPTAATQTSVSPTGSAALIYFIADHNLRSACSEESRVCGCAARSERLPATRGRRDAFHRHDQCTPVRLNVPCPHILLLPRVPLPLRILRRTDGRTSPDERLRFRATPCDAASPTAWYPPRHGIPHSMVSPTAWYPPQHGIPHSMVSPTPWYPPRHGIPHAMVSPTAWSPRVISAAQATAAHAQCCAARSRVRVRVRTRRFTQEGNGIGINAVDRRRYRCSARHWPTCQCSL
jgi:hypothetical protein